MPDCPRLDADGLPCSGEPNHSGYCRNYTVNDSCPTCSGTGISRTGDRMNPFGRCLTCRGTKRVRLERKTDVHGTYSRLEPKCPDPCTFRSLGYSCPVHLGPVVESVGR